MPLDDADESRLKLGRARAAAIVGSAIFLGISALFLTAAISQRARLAQDERVRVLLEASAIRVAIESGLAERISLERGIVAFFVTAPDVDADDYATFASALLMGDPVVKNLAMLEGTTIKYVYPYEPNKAAVGKDLSLIPDQAEAVLRAMTAREPVIDGPIRLVQGGAGIVSRMGIYRDSPSGPRYWGQASVVIDSDEVLKRAGVQDHPTLDFMLEEATAEGGAAFYGSRELLQRNPVLLEVALPGATWTLAAAPKEGWRTYGWLAFAVTALGAVIGAFAGVAAYGLLSTRSALKEMAYHDQLTELPNRALFWDRLRVEATRAERDGTSVCVFMIDLDDFKSVNDDLGHKAGDTLLSEAARRMGGAVRRSDTIARLGGDEFAVIASVEAPEGVEELRSRLAECFVEPFDLGPVKRTAKASIGCGLYPVEAPDVEAALALADKRMYQGKRSAR